MVKASEFFFEFNVCLYKCKSIRTFVGSSKYAVAAAVSSKWNVCAMEKWNSLSLLHFSEIEMGGGRGWKDNNAIRLLFDERALH